MNIENESTVWPILTYRDVRAALAFHARAMGAGAEVVRDLVDEDYGSRGFTVRDPEGDLWSFGTYRGSSG